MKRLVLFVLTLLCASCKDATAPSIDPYALFYIRNDKTSSPIYYTYIRFPNRVPMEESLIGSVGPGEEVCGKFGLESITPGDPANMVQLVLKVYQGDSVINPVIDTIKSSTVDPFALGANTPQTPHRFRLWFKADGSTFFDFGRYDETSKWADAPGWPCPTVF